MNMTPTSMPLDSLRQRFCHAPGCRTLFFVCKRCDRGQRYCSPKCRQESRRQQFREASCRYQQSERGRLAHLQRQRRYRKKCSKVSVTHQRVHHTVLRGPESFSKPTKCIICRQESHWINPYYEISPLRRRKSKRVCVGESSKKYVFT